MRSGEQHDTEVGFRADTDRDFAYWGCLVKCQMRSLVDRAANGRFEPKPTIFRNAAYVSFWFGLLVSGLVWNPDLRFWERHLNEPCYEARTN